VTLGEALVAIAPKTPTGLHRAPALRMHPGGAEVNLAVGLARLGISAEWVGRVGDDPLGRLVLDALRAEGVTARATLDGDRPTGLYLREWLPDGTRRFHAALSVAPSGPILELGRRFYPAGPDREARRAVGAGSLKAPPPAGALPEPANQAMADLEGNIPDVGGRGPVASHRANHAGCHQRCIAPEAAGAQRGDSARTGTISGLPAAWPAHRHRRVGVGATAAAGGRAQLHGPRAAWSMRPP
jgi:hypothetical protein